MNNTGYSLGLLLTAGAAFAAGWIIKPAAPVIDQSPLTNVGSGSLIKPKTATNSQDALAPDPSQIAVETENFMKRHLKGGILDASGMAKAMEEVMKESDPVKQNRMVAELLESLSKDNAKEALAAISDMGRRNPASFYMTALFNSAWGRIDGEAAVLNAKENGQGRMAGMGVATALSGWAMENPDDAMAWVASQEDTGMTKMMYEGGLINGLARTDPDAATEYLEKMEGNEEAKGRYLDTIATEKMKEGIDEATKWATNLTDPSLKEEAFLDLANQYTQKDPSKAAEWIEGQAGEPHARKAIEEVADEWAEIDPKAAFEWSVTLDGDVQGDAVEASFKEWAESDPTTASEYLTEMDASPAKDNAISGFTDKLAGEDPEAALTWATTIQNEEIRIDAIEDAARTWYRKDAEAAGAWLETSGLSGDSVTKITAEPERRGSFDFLRGRR